MQNYSILSAWIVWTIFRSLPVTYWRGRAKKVTTLKQTDSLVRMSGNQTFRRLDSSDGKSEERLHTERQKTRCDCVREKSPKGREREMWLCSAHRVEWLLNWRVDNWAICLSICSFACTAHTIACSELLNALKALCSHSLAGSRTHLLTHSYAPMG